MVEVVGHMVVAAICCTGGTWVTKASVSLHAESPELFTERTRH
jgi:hypothetical protein